jgi:hypothetical protein
VDFIRSAWPQQYLPVSDLWISNFYDDISFTNLGDWIETAFTDIESHCVAPALASNVTFNDLDLTKDCGATANYYAGTLGAINPATSNQ